MMKLVLLGLGLGAIFTLSSCTEKEVFRCGKVVIKKTEKWNLGGCCGGGGRASRIWVENDEGEFLCGRAYDRTISPNGRFLLVNGSTTERKSRELVCIDTSTGKVMARVDVTKRVPLSNSRWSPDGENLVCPTKNDWGSGWMVISLQKGKIRTFHVPRKEISQHAKLIGVGWGPECHLLFPNGKKGIRSLDISLDDKQLRIVP